MRGRRAGAGRDRSCGQPLPVRLRVVAAQCRGRATWVSVSPLFARALRIAIDAAAWTDGLVDPTVGGVLVDHGYDRTFTAVAPDGPVNVLVREVPGPGAVELDEANLPRPGPDSERRSTSAQPRRRLLRTSPQLRHGKSAGGGVLVSLGGDISVSGDAPKGGWPLTVTDRSDLSLPPDDGISE